MPDGNHSEFHCQARLGSGLGDEERRCKVVPVEGAAGIPQRACEGIVKRRVGLTRIGHIVVQRDRRGQGVAQVVLRLEHGLGTALVHGGGWAVS